jgi:hypothetical protein
MSRMFLESPHSWHIEALYRTHCFCLFYLFYWFLPFCSVRCSCVPYYLLQAEVGDESSVMTVLCCRLLKPYIRRDMETTPLWLCLLDEVQAKANRNVPHWRPPARHPIDYSYVRPQHISSVNSLCQEFFYPGIDCKYICFTAHCALINIFLLQG